MFLSAQIIHGTTNHLVSFMGGKNMPLVMHHDARPSAVRCATAESDASKNVQGNVRGKVQKRRLTREWPRSPAIATQRHSPIRNNLPPHQGHQYAITRFEHASMRMNRLRVRPSDWLWQRQDGAALTASPRHGTMCHRLCRSSLPNPLNGSAVRRKGAGRRCLRVWAAQVAIAGAVRRPLGRSTMPLSDVAILGGAALAAFFVITLRGPFDA